MLADSVAGFARQHDGVARARALSDGAGLDRQAWAAMADLGLMGILVPESAGGLGLGIPEMAVVAEELGRGCAPEPLAALAAAQSTLARTGSEAAQALLTGCADGSTLVALAWQDAADQLEPASIACRADTVDGEVLLSGSKCLVSPAEADVFIVSAVDNGAPALFLVPRDAEGLQLETQQQVDGSAAATLTLNRVQLSADACLCTGDDALQALETGIAAGLTLASAELLGLADRLYTLTTDYLATRKQFGVPISSFQVLRHRSVDLYIQRELMRAALNQAVRAFEEGVFGEALQRAASRAKARAGDAAQLIAREAVQLHGAIGFTEEADVGVHLRRVLVLSAWLGNAGLHRRRYRALSRQAA